jgi:hypothetical protein
MNRPWSQPDSTRRAPGFSASDAHLVAPTANCDMHQQVINGFNWAVTRSSIILGRNELPLAQAKIRSNSFDLSRSAIAGAAACPAVRSRCPQSNAIQIYCTQTD